MEETMETTEVVEEYEEEYEEGGPSGFSLALNRYFHHIDRGGSLGGEITAGIVMFFVSICVLFMNMQFIGGVLNAGVTISNTPADPKNIAAATVYTQLYAGSILAAILGTLLVGIVARLPFSQVSTMGFASSLLCLVGTETGLTWQNLLFVNLVAAVIFAVLVAVPKLRQFVFDAIPEPVRKAFPAAMGLIIAFTALKMTGLVTTTEISLTGASSIKLISGLAVSNLRSLALCGIIGGAVAAALYILLALLKRKHPVILALVGGTAVFAVATVVLNGTDTSNTESFINFGRVWLIAGSQASAATPFADSYLTYAMDAIRGVFANFPQVFTKGMDFSGYSGSTIALVFGGVVSYVFAGLFSAQGVMLASEERLNAQAEEAGKVDFHQESGVRGALVCGALANIAAPLFGVGGMSFGVGSVAGARDNGKSGISSIVAGIGFAISLFVMAFPALFATVTHPVASMNEWNYFAYGNGGFVYLVQDVVFTVADFLMICLGVGMAASLAKLDWRALGQWLPAAATVLAALLTANLVIGAALGCVVYLIVSLIGNRSAIRIPMVVATVLMIVGIVLL